MRDVQATPGTPLTESPPIRRRPRRVGVLLAVAVFVLAADIISKAIVVAHIREGTYIHLIGTVLMLTQVRNGGAAFGNRSLCGRRCGHSLGLVLGN